MMEAVYLQEIRSLEGNTSISSCGMVRPRARQRIHIYWLITGRRWRRVHGAAAREPGWSCARRFASPDRTLSTSHA